MQHRFGATPVEVRPVQGITERIVDGKLHLNLRDFLELVLKNSTAVNLTRLDVYTAADQITATKAPLDPQLVASYNVLKEVSPSFTQISGAATLSDLTETSVLSYQQLIPTGQTINVNFNAARTSTNDAFNFYNPDIFGTLNISILQPLLQDRTRIEFKGPQEIARTQLLITTDQSMATIATTLADAAGQYWDAVRSRDDIKVEQQTFDLAQKSYDRDKQALDLGALASLDIYQSETQVAERRRDLIQAQYTYRADLDGLRRLIGADLTPETRRAEIVLDDNPSVLPPKSLILPFEEALASALKVRPEADAARRSLVVDDLNARIAHNLLLPRLDLTVQGAATGLSGTGVPVVGLLGNPTPIASTGFGTSLGQVLSFAYPGYGGGLQFTLPVRNSSASAQLSDALVNRARDKYSQRQVQQQITLDVRQAINALELANATIEAATTARNLAVKNVAAEQQKYELGTITAFEVLDSQNRLASSESALLNTFVGYQEAFINYQRATWTLLDGLGMVLETPKIH
jgi:outer membrane protein